ncbi:MAG: SCO family protein [Thermoanaerobaculaceae bacterium]
MNHSTGVERKAIWLAVVTLLVSAVPGPAQRQEPLPRELEGVGVDEKLGARVPLDLAFTDESGRQVTLGQYFRPGRPVLLTLNYYQCPMLCTLQLNGLVDALRELPLSPGREFEIVTVSINPLETPPLAAGKKKVYLESLGRPGAEVGWHFLVGRQPEIATLADAVGFRYRYNEARKEYVHAAAFMLLTPEGVVARYLYGVMLEPRTVKLGLAEASAGKLGSTADRILLMCFHYDANAGRYVVAASRLMQAGGIVTALSLGTWLGRWWWREKRGSERKR